MCSTPVHFANHCYTISESQRKKDHEEAEDISSQLSEVTDRLLKLREENREHHVLVSGQLLTQLV